jgi:hypothetical protein
MATNRELLYRKILVLIGDINDVEIRLNDIICEAQNAKVLGKELEEDFIESQKTIDRLKKESNIVLDRIDEELE